jgi:hypothetical protein
LPPINIPKLTIWQADRIGLDLVARACFNPTAAVGVFQRLAAHEKENVSSSKALTFLSTHPASDTRVEQFQVRAQGYQHFFLLPNSCEPRAFTGPNAASYPTCASVLC